MQHSEHLYPIFFRKFDEPATGSKFKIYCLYAFGLGIALPLSFIFLENSQYHKQIEIFFLCLFLSFPIIVTILSIWTAVNVISMSKSAVYYQNASFIDKRER